MDVGNMKSSVDDKLVIKKKVKQPIVFPQVGGSDIVVIRSWNGKTC